MKKKKKPKKKTSRFLTISIAAIIIGIAIFYFYSADQAQNRGSIFGNEIKGLQNDIAFEQNRFISSIAQWEEGTIKDEEIIIIGELHLEEFNKLLKKYDELQPPDAFPTSVKLLKLSLEYQIQSHEHRLEWIKSGDELELVRSQELTQLSFEAEQAGLKAFNDAKLGKKTSLEQKLTKEEFNKTKEIILAIAEVEEAVCVKQLGSPFENLEQRSDYEKCVNKIEKNKELELKSLEGRCCI